MKNLVWLSTSMLVAWIPSFADMATFPAATDTSISARAPDNNFGADDSASAGRDGDLAGNVRRALFKFDLTFN